MTQEWDVARTRLELLTRLKWFLGKFKPEVPPKSRVPFVKTSCGCCSLSKYRNILRLTYLTHVF